jgi:LAO/AO transport system kinase
MDLVSQILEGNRLALSRVLTQIENGTPQGQATLDALFPFTGQAHLIGVTGAPGTGKSSLVNQLARAYRAANGQSDPPSVAVVAVDPSSPFTGGAILGDRIRMRDLSGDPGVFIRSMASRGTLGGIAQTTAGVVQAFDAAGFNFILIETVGAGQAEVDIARLAHTTLVVEAPGMGDDIQAIKAGILEIADILVVNKADRPGVENTERALRNMLQLAHPAPRIFQHHGGQTGEVYAARAQTAGAETAEAETTPAGVSAEIWIPPIQRTVATEGEGVENLLKLIEQHRAYLLRTGELFQRDRLRFETELEQLLQRILMIRWREAISDDQYQATVELISSRKLSPRQAAFSLVDGDSI